jgi:AcrR family transcriptional regulator
VSAPLRKTSVDSTRAKIRRTAERLFAQYGVDPVTLRQIARAAGQSNVSAVQYHFGTKEKLLEEILAAHLDSIDRRRREMLDDQEQRGDAHNLALLMRTLIDPLTEKLDDPSGRAYLQIQAGNTTQLEMRPATRLMTTRIARALGGETASALAERFSVVLLFGALAERAEQEAGGVAGPQDRSDFVDGLSRALLGVFRGVAGTT